MVFFFTTTHNNITWSIHMGRDKYENEDLIKYGTPADIWFHVDDLSSAHVYLRLPPGFAVDSIPSEVLTECAALVKANSIEGCKKTSVKIVYTPWANLKKRGDMEVGQIGFHDTKQLKYMNIEKRNEIVNRLNRTKQEKETIVIREFREEFDRKQRAFERKMKRDAADEAKAAAEDRKKKEEEESYTDLFASTQSMQSNRNMRVTAEEYENDFM